MHLVRSLIRQLRSFGQRRTVKQEIDEELSFHLEQRMTENIATGMPPDQAARDARKRFGNLQTIREECRATRGASFGEATWDDIRFGLRMLAKSPGTTAIVALSLSFAIAANTTVFSFVNALLIRPVPVEAPEQLWQIWRLRPNASSEMKRYGAWSRPSIAHLRANARSCAAIGAFEAEPTLGTWYHHGAGESVQSLFVSGNFFEVCAIKPALGRFFMPDEDVTPGTHPAVVVSHAFWKNRLGADAQAVGSALTINGVSLTIIGVAPRSFAGVVAAVTPDLWLPLMMAPSILHDPEWNTRRDTHSLIGLGRLKKEVSAVQAAAELTVLTHQFDEPHQEDGTRGEDAILMPALMVPGPVRGYIRAFTGMLMGAVLLVLLIACANTANLQLARATARQQEMAIRSAMGATRTRLIRQLLTESVLLAMLGGGLGLLLSAWLARLIANLIPSNLPIRLAVEFDWRVLAFTAAISLVTGIIFGTSPAFRCTQVDLASTLKDGARGVSVQRSRLVSLLIVGQIALCLVLLLAAALCGRSFLNARSVDPGFVSRDRITADFNLRDLGCTADQAREYCARLVARVETIPGVQSAALTSYLPFGLERINGTFQLEGREPTPGDHGFFFEQFSVGPGYFATIGATLLQGREFTKADREGALRVAIINEAAAKRYWPGENPIGRRLFNGSPNPENALEIVGVVETGRYRTLGEEPRPVFYECFLQGSQLSGTIVTHIQGAPGAALAAVRLAAREVDARLAFSRIAPLEQHVALALFPVRTSSLLLGGLGFVGLVLAVSGLFGVVSYSVAQRSREVGIRMALGAQRRDVLRLLFVQGLKLAGFGLLLGLGSALATTRLLQSLLFGVSAIDPVTFIAVPMVLFGIASLACWIPARRAALVDPMVALRTE